MLTRRSGLLAAVTVALVTSTLAATPAGATAPPPVTSGSTGAAEVSPTSHAAHWLLGHPAARARVARYAADTWRSLTAMVDPRTGLPADNIDGDLSPATRSGYTSPTNIGGYLWSTVAARDLGLISGTEAYQRMRATLGTLGTLDRHTPSGMFYNWYDEASGQVLHTWPEDGSVVHPFLSSVDNGWLAAALMVVQRAEPRLAGQARALLAPMDFGMFYDPAAQADQGLPGLLRGGFWDADPGGQTCSVPGNYLHRGPDVWYTCNHYDITVTEPRIASYIGIARGQIPPEHYYATHRTFPASCDWAWLEQRPVGVTRHYRGVPVFEGAYTYRGMRIVPSWGGDMFEALMPDLFVPEAVWGPDSWGVNHPLTVRAQIEHGMVEAGYGYWGFSPASDPQGGYAAWGVDAIGMDPGGYPSDLARTNVDAGYPGCREGTNPEPTFSDGVVTPHASFLALPYAPAAAVANLDRLRTRLGAYGPGGFYDAVAVGSDTLARRYLALDQSMIMGAVGNVLADDALHRYFSSPSVAAAIRPLLAPERFGAGWAPSTPGAADAQPRRAPAGLPR